MANRVPACVSIPLSKLCEAARAFIENCNQFEERAQAIGHELQELSDEYKKMETETTCKNRTGGALKGLGYVAALATAFGVGHTVLRGEDEKALAAGGLVLLSLSAAAAVETGDSTVLNANVKKALTQQDMMKSLKALVEEFMTIIGAQRTILDDIITFSDELNENSSIVRTEAGAQAKKTLSDIKKFQGLQNEMNELTEDVKAAHLIAESARQCEKTLTELLKMRSKFKEFEQN